jgi:hypothetical protein
MDDLHCKWADSNADQPLDHPSLSFGILRVAGATYLHVLDAYLHLRDLDNLLPELAHERPNSYLESRERE